MICFDVCCFLCVTDVQEHTEIIQRERRNETLRGWRLSFNMQQLRGKKSRRKVKYAELAIYGKHCNADAGRKYKIAARRTSILTFTQLQLAAGSSKKDWVPVVSRQHIRLRDCWQRFNVTLAVEEWQKKWRGQRQSASPGYEAAR